MIIGTRGSALALSQAEGVRAQVAALFPGREVRLEVFKTTGDRFSASNLPEGPQEMTVQGIFTKELDEALLGGKIQAAVHSLKDVPTVLQKGIRFGAFLKREDPRDALVSKNGKKFLELPSGSRLGTSSPRREAQIRAARSDLQVKRLGLQNEITEYWDPAVITPAPAQGVLCLTILDSDRDLLEALKPLDDSETRICAEAERSFLRTLQGGCRVPVGALAEFEEGQLRLSGVIAQSNGKQVLRQSQLGKVEQPVELGEKLAEMFLSLGAREILKHYGRT